MRILVLLLLTAAIHNVHSDDGARSRRLALDFGNVVDNALSFMDVLGFDGSGIELLKKLYNAAIAEENLLLQRKAIELLMRTCNFILSYLPTEPVRKNKQLEALKHLKLIQFTKSNSETRRKRNNYYINFPDPVPVEITTRKYEDSFKISDDSHRFSESTINKNFYFKFDLDGSNHRNKKRETQQEILLRKIEKANQEIEQIKADIQKLIEEIDASSYLKEEKNNLESRNSDNNNQEIDFIDFSLTSNVMTTIDSTDFDEFGMTTTEASSLNDVEITTRLPEYVGDDQILSEITPSEEFESDSSDDHQRKTKIVGIQVVIENDFTTDSFPIIDDFSTEDELRVTQISIDDFNENPDILSDDEESATEEKLRITQVSEVAENVDIPDDDVKEEFDVNILDVTEKSVVYEVADPEVATNDSDLLNDKSDDSNEANKVVDVVEKLSDPELTEIDHKSLKNDVNKTGEVESENDDDDVVYITPSPSEAPSSEVLLISQETEEIQENDITTMSGELQHIEELPKVLEDATSNLTEDGWETESYTTEAAVYENTSQLIQEFSSSSEETEIEVTTIEQQSIEGNNLEESLFDVADVSEVADSEGKSEETSESNYEEPVEILNVTVEPSNEGGDHLTKLLKIEINPVETDENEDFDVGSILEDSVNEPSNLQTFRVKPDLFDSNFYPYDDDSSDLLLVYPQDYNNEDFKEFGAKILPGAKNTPEKSTIVNKRFKSLRNNEAATSKQNKKFQSTYSTRINEAFMQKMLKFPKKPIAYLKIEDKSERKPKVVDIISNEGEMTLEMNRAVERPTVSLFKKYQVEELENAYLRHEPNPALPEIFKALKSFNDSAEFDYVPTLIDWDASDSKSNFKNVSEVLTNIQEHINNNGKYIVSNATEPKKFVYVVVNKSLIASPMKKRFKRQLSTNYFENAVARFRQISSNFKGFSSFNHQPKNFNNYLEPKPIGKLIKEAPKFVNDQVVSYITKKNGAPKIVEKEISKNHQVDDVQFNYLPHVNMYKDFGKINLSIKTEEPKVMFYGVVPNPQRLQEFSSESNFNSYDTKNWFKTDYSEMNKKVFDEKAPNEIFYGVVPDVKRLHTFFSENHVNDLLLTSVISTTVATSEDEVGEDNFEFNFLPHYDMYNDFSDMNQKIKDQLTFVEDNKPPVTMFYGVLPNKEKAQEFKQENTKFDFDYLPHRNMYKKFEEMNQKIMDHLPDKSAPDTMFYGVLPNKEKIQEFKQTVNFILSQESSELDEVEDFVFSKKGFNELPYVKKKQIFDTKIYFQLILDKVKRRREEAIKRKSIKIKIEDKSNKMKNQEESLQEDQKEKSKTSAIVINEGSKNEVSKNEDLGFNSLPLFDQKHEFQLTKNYVQKNLNIEATTSAIASENEISKNEDLSFNSLPLFDQKQEFQLEKNDHKKTLNIEDKTTIVIEEGSEDIISKNEDFGFNNLPLFDQKQEFHLVKNNDKKTLNIETTTTAIASENEVSKNEDLSFNSLPLFDQKQEFQLVINDDKKTWNIEATTTIVIEEGSEDTISKNENFGFNNLPLFDQKQEFQLVENNDKKYLNIETTTSAIVIEDEVSKNEYLGFNRLPFFDQNFPNFDSEIEKVVNKDAEENRDEDNELNNEENIFTDLYDVHQLVKPNQTKVEKKIEELETILSEGNEINDIPKNNKIVKNEQDFFSEVGSAIGKNFGNNLAEDFRKFVYNLEENNLLIENDTKIPPLNIYKPAVKFNNFTEEQFVSSTTVEDLPNLENPRIEVPSEIKVVNLDESADGVFQALDQILKIEATTTANNQNSDEIVKNLGVKSFPKLNSHRGDVMDDLESDESLEENMFKQFPLNGPMLYLSKLYNPEGDVDGKKLLAFMYPEFGKKLNPKTK